MFLEERKHSLNWLSELRNPPWDNQYQHPKLGPMTARQFLLNWLAHDFLHLRQIIRTKYQYMQSKSDTDVSYAGNW
jgi:hypothetical protein